jgi:hypothetical protein
MSFTKTINYENIDITKVEFNNFKDDSNFKLFSCVYDNYTFNITSPSIKFVYNINKNKLFNNQFEFFIPVNNNNINFNNKINEFQILIESDDFRTKYDIPLDYKCINIIKKSSNPKYPDQFKTKLDSYNNIIKTNVCQLYSYKNNPSKIFKKKIDLNTESDLYNLINSNTYIKTKIQPFMLWINKNSKMYGLTFKIIDIEISKNENLNSYDYQFVLLDEEAINYK